MNTFIPSCNLSTATKHFSTHDDRSFDYTEYLYSLTGSLDPIGLLTHGNEPAALCIIFARPYTIGWDPITIRFDDNEAFPNRIESSLRLYTSPNDLYTTFGRLIYTPAGT
ncbi:hypothetical protein [Microaerobacter geothermalis]|uniref:hypothetical protein n=1 Tax=Microaerobacter geothermalis TaxID=674972 RepID=UPI001F41C7A7|nr:hypothetical protein [Microaerobacter geothermalis]